MTLDVKEATNLANELTDLVSGSAHLPDSQRRAGEIFFRLQGFAPSDGYFREKWSSAKEMVDHFFSGRTSRRFKSMNAFNADLCGEISKLQMAIATRGRNAESNE